MKNTNLLFKVNTVKAGVFLAVAVAAANSQAATLITDTFENRPVGEVLQTNTSGPNIPLMPWAWHNAGGISGPEVAEYKGNKFINLSGKTLTTASFTDGNTNLVLAANEKHSLAFDLLWLDNTPASADSNALLVYFNVNNRYANVPATNNIQGFRFGIMATGPDTATYFIQQKTTGFQDVVRGSVQVRGLINRGSSTTPGTALPVVLEWDAKRIALKINGAVVFDSDITAFSPTPANSNIQGNTFLQIWADPSKARGLDNVIFKSSGR